MKNIDVKNMVSITLAEFRKVFDEKSFLWINVLDDLTLIDLKALSTDEKTRLSEKYISNLIEARFFDKNSEIRMLQTPKGIRKFEIAHVPYEAEIKYVEDVQVVTKRKSLNKDIQSRLIVRKYIEHDEFGQAYITNTALYDVL